mgnify:FL=1|jgi:hypothetical protein
MRLKKIAVGLASILGLLLIISGCQTKHSKTQTLTGYDVVNIRRLAVMPFLPGNTALNADEQVRPALDCTMMEFCEEVNDELGMHAETALTRQMQRAMELKLDDKVVPLARAAEIYDDLPQNRKVDTPRQLAQRFGKATGADYVIIGSVWRYRDPTPGLGASVAFTVYLLEADTGRRVWRGRFDKTQQALTDDLQDAGSFFTKGGGRWLSAEELARFGIEKVMQSFPETVA